MFVTMASAKAVNGRQAFPYSLSVSRVHIVWIQIFHLMWPCLLRSVYTKYAIIAYYHFITNYKIVIFLVLKAFYRNIDKILTVSFPFIVGRRETCKEWVRGERLNEVNLLWSQGHSHVGATIADGSKGRRLVAWKPEYTGWCFVVAFSDWPHSGCDLLLHVTWGRKQGQSSCYSLPTQIYHPFTISISMTRYLHDKIFFNDWLPSFFFIVYWLLASSSSSAGSRCPQFLLPDSFWRFLYLSFISHHYWCNG